TGAPGGTIMNPPVLSGAFRTFNANSEVSRSGYLFHMILPGAAGIGVIETSSGNLGANVDIDLTETSWCCYAWPASYSTSGNRTFFVNQTGDIIGCDFATYSGTNKINAANAGAAFKTGGAVTNITGIVAVGTKGRDNNVWKQIN